MKNSKHIHMLGIGGAGMAGLAQLLWQQGYTISGSDCEHSATVERLTAMGIPVTIGNDLAPLQTADACVYSAAITPEHPLLQAANQWMPTLSRGEAMGRLSHTFGKVAAVAGTHGKTTVTGLLTHILLQTDADPSVLIGGNLPSIDGNGRWGDSSLLICEACEYAGSFFHLKRDLGILLNIDNDHLECYGSMEHLCRAFEQFADGCHTLLVCSQDEQAMKTTAKHPRRFTYGTRDSDSFRLVHTKENHGFYTVELCLQGHTLPPVSLSVPGCHNALNALAAAGAATLLGCPPSAIVKGLSSFCGVGRRFEVRYRDEQVMWVDDYAHHPKEIEAVLTAARAMEFSRVTAVFQPFTFSRTKLLGREFAQALSKADRVILTPVMGGREPIDPTVTAHTIAEHLPKAVIGRDFAHCAHLAAHNVKEDELILTMGCGNVYRCGEQIAALLQTNQKSRYDSHKIT